MTLVRAGLAVLLSVAAFVVSATARAQLTTRSAQRSVASERALVAAERELALGQIARATRRLESALGRDPRDLRLLARYASLAVPLASEPSATPQRLKGARGLMERIARREELPSDPAVQYDPELERLVVLHAALAEALLVHDDESFALVRAAGRLQDPGTVLCLRQIAALAVTRDRLDLAEQALALARQYYLQDLTLGAELGHVLLARGRGEAALRLFAERYAIEPAQLEARRDLAYALVSEGRAGEALALLSADRDACERSLGCTLEAARIALEAGRLEEALRYAEKRLERDGADLDALFITADAHTRAGRLDDARRSYERVLALRPDSVRAQQALEQLPASNPVGH
jgi:tetratricopeptide (TPR) repeat protein